MLDLSHAIWIDFETAAPAVNLKTAGAVRYAAHPSTQAIVLAWAVDDGAAQSWHSAGDILDGAARRGSSRRRLTATAR